MVLTLGANSRASYAAPSVRHQCVAGDNTETASAAAGLSIVSSSSANNNNNSTSLSSSSTVTTTTATTIITTKATITATSVTNTTSETREQRDQPPQQQQQQQQAPIMSSKVSRLLINLNCLTPRNDEAVRQNSGNHPSSPPDNQKKPSGPASTNDSDRPQLSDVVSWNESFDNLLNSKKGRQVFQNFLKQEFSDENLLFWIACEELKNEKSKDAIEERARMIYEDFISVLSPKEVSLDARVREQVNRAMVEPRANIFDEAQLQVYMLMKRDSYPRFISSPIYKKLMQDAGKGSSSLTAATSSRAGAAAGPPESSLTAS